MASSDQIHFVTGRLAQHALRRIVKQLAAELGFNYTIDVLPITVAALMTPQWVQRHLQPPDHATRIILPGYCAGDLEPLSKVLPVPVERGPKDLRQLPEFLGAKHQGQSLDAHDIEIVAEINHAPQLQLDELRRQARSLADAGADLIDVGCDPGDPWSGVGDAVRALRDDGHRVSVDSFNPREIAPAVRAGAELVLSVNASNREAAVDWGCEVVVIPDQIPTLGGLRETVEFLAERRVPLRIDPILEPIGCGFAGSLNRYLEVRRCYPDAEILMGIGNLTELSDVDSAGINFLLLGFCQETGIRSVLTTQVINWARSSVRECDLARRLVHYAVREGTPPKNLDPRLVVLRDTRLFGFSDDDLEALARQIRDHNYRLFAHGEKLRLLAAGVDLEHEDPYELFDALMQTGPKNIDASHAFYLGYELAKAVTARTLGKQYRQDEALDWGHLTVSEESHLERKARRRKDRSAPAGKESEELS